MTVVDTKKSKAKGSYKQEKNFTIDFTVVCIVPYWSSIRFSIAFIGFLGMITHFLQRTNISIALVCMVNHTAIEHYYSSPSINNSTSTTSVSVENSCSETKDTNNNTVSE